MCHLNHTPAATVHCTCLRRIYPFTTYGVVMAYLPLGGSTLTQRPPISAPHRPLSATTSTCFTALTTLGCHDTLAGRLSTRYPHRCHLVGAESRKASQAAQIPGSLWHATLPRLRIYQP